VSRSYLMPTLRRKRSMVIFVQWHIKDVFGIVLALRLGSIFSINLASLTNPPCKKREKNLTSFLMEI
jgi:hypothetical protein